MVANARPVLSGFNLSVTLDEEAVNLAPQLIDADVTFSDVDNNFDGGTLVLSGLAAGDILAIRNQGTGAGEIGLSGPDVTYEGTVIGTFAGGSGGTALSVTFNAQANSAAIEALIENLTYQNLSDTPDFARALHLIITDAAGAHAVAPVVMQAVTGVANPLNGVNVGLQSTPSFADLDGDGDLDVVVGAIYDSIKYYENAGTGVAPAYVAQTGGDNPFNGFSVGGVGRGAPSLADLDGDGDFDAVVGEFYGTLKYFENTGTALAPAYAVQTGAANPFNGIDFGYNSSPSFADLDGDGDLDAVVGESDGNLNYYENTGTGVAPVYVEQNGAANPFDGIDVGVGSRPSFADLDGDGDLDAVIGERFGTLKYFENAGTGVAPAYVERAGAANPFNGIQYVGYSAPGFADLDGDGDLDAVSGEFYGTLQYFENIRPPYAVAPMVMQEVTGAANPFNGIDVGTFSAPSFADLDGDGDLDAVIGDYVGMLKYFENTGDGVAPVYITRTGAANPFNGIDVSNYSSPAFADLDGDGDLDAVIGEVYGTLKYYENTGTGVAPAYVERTGAASPFNGISIPEQVARPAFGDLDGDGDLDVVVGTFFGGLKYFENTGTGIAPAYVQHTGAANPFGAINVGLFVAPALADFDRDGDLDAVLGEYHGSIKYYENTGTALLPSYVEGTGATNPFSVGGDVNANIKTTPAIADLDGDGDLDAVVGEANGALKYYENTGPTGFKFVLEVTPHADPSAGPDVMNGTAGADAIDALGGNDTLDGGAGDDSLSGGLDTDTASYVSAGAGVTVSLALQGAGQNTGGAGNDTLAGFENLSGSNFDDALAGDANANGLDGGSGNDTLNGGAGADSIAGGAGIDTLVFSAGIQPGVWVDLSANAVYTDTSGSSDYVSGIEAVEGTDDDDTLYGDGLANRLSGRGGLDEIGGFGGNDTLEGGADNDSLAGGADTDTASYASAGAGVMVSLAAQGAGQNTGGAGNDTLTGFENLTGSGFNDALTGDANANRLEGGPGVDSLAGGGGDDTLVVTATAADGGSRIVFLRDAVVENPGGGSDTVYSSASFVLPDEVENLVLTGAPMWRAYTGTGNEFGNVITGEGAARHRLFGEGGNDTLDGGAGPDVLNGGAGDDVLVYDAADTLITGGAGSDTLMVASGALDLTAIADAVIQNVEVIDLTAGANTLTLAFADVLAISSSTDTLRVDGDGGDSFDIPDFGVGWVQEGNQTIGLNDYYTFTQSSAILLVDTNIANLFPL